nr:hypothetical protein [Tanacetum cinerariifolium]
MVAILEKNEHNANFHPIVDFIEASPLRYALTIKPTIYVSHIRQFWSAARIETTTEGTQILATVDGVLRTVAESSLRRNLKLQDEEGISSLRDTGLFENLTLMGYNISPNQKFTFQKATVLAGGIDVPTGNYSIPTAGPPVVDIYTGSDAVPTAKVARIHAKEELQGIVDSLDRTNETIAKYFEHNSDFHPIVDFIEASPLSSNIATALVFLATNRTYNFSKMIFDGLVKNINIKVSKFLMYPRFLGMCLRMAQFVQITHTQKYVVPFHTKKLFTTLRVNSPSFSGRIVPFFDSMLVQQGEGSRTPTEPHPTPSQEAQPSSPTHISTSSIPTVIPIPTVTQSERTPLRQYTRRARIAQSSALLPVVDEPASPVRDVSEGEACLTDSGFIADQDRATIAKSSTLPYDTAPRVTSPAAVEGSMQQTIHELTDLCTSLQRQHSELLIQFQAQKVEINKLNVRVKILEDNQGVIGARSADDALINRRRIDEQEGITGRVSSDTEEIRMDEGEVAVERTSEDT